MGLKYEIKDKTVDDIKGLYERGQINTSPIFQRKSVWKDKDRLKLINSILQNNPIPSIFLYQREHNGKLIYDVIDGKQRLETILKYLEPKYKGIEGTIKGSFKNDNDEVIEIEDFKNLDSDKRSQVLRFTAGVIIVSGEYKDILNLFININSLGAPLKKQEIRNAKFIDSGVIKHVNNYIKKRSNLKYINYLSQIKNIDPNRNQRMALEEFIIELLISTKTKTVQDGKSVLDKILSDKTEKIDLKTQKIFNSTLAWMQKIISIDEVKTTRLVNKSDFYSLYFYLSSLQRENYLSNSTSNKIAKEILFGFYANVDKMFTKGSKTNLEGLSEYKESIQRSTDSAPNRLTRSQILNELLSRIFTTKKDKDRTFSTLQKRILWNKIKDDPKCLNCDTLLSWNDVTIDHILPWSKGGKTDLNNGQILCTKCNSSKGNR